MDIVIELLLNEEKKIKERLQAIQEKLKDAGYYTDTRIVDENSARASSSNEGKYSHFTSKDSIKEQVLEVLKTENRFMFKREIVDILLPFHRNRGFDRLTTRVTSELSSAKGVIDNLISYQYSTSKSDTVWGNKNWLDENGTPKPEHMYVLPENKKNQKTFSF